MRNNKQQSHRQQGFTLVEIMIALLVFMVVMLGVAGGLIQAIRANRGNVVRDEALRLAEEELNRLKGERFSVFGTSADLTATGFPPDPAAIQDIQVTIRGGTVPFERLSEIIDMGTFATALKRIEVVVGWNDPGNAGAVLAPTNRTRQVSLSTIIVRSD
ncbi:MAG: type IV pilus modification PilV family protein [Desulfobulbia bacterium]